MDNREALSVKIQALAMIDETMCQLDQYADAFDRLAKSDSWDEVDLALARVGICGLAGLLFVRRAERYETLKELEEPQ